MKRKAKENDVDVVEFETTVNNKYCLIELKNGLIHRAYCGPSNRHYWNFTHNPDVVISCMSDDVLSLAKFVKLLDKADKSFLVASELLLSKMKEFLSTLEESYLILEENKLLSVIEEAHKIMEEENNE